MFITRVTAITDEFFNAITCLIPQLTLTSPLPTREEMERMIASDSCVLLAARFSDQDAGVMGVLTLIIYRVPTGIRAHIEDVVVDESMRGKGIGEELVRHALNMAREAGADGVVLTSNPKREAANRLYQRLGFAIWETNLYFYKF